MLLQSSKASEAHQGFAASVEQMDGRRRAAAESVREQQAFIAVLQALSPRLVLTTYYLLLTTYYFLLTELSSPCSRRPSSGRHLSSAGWTVQGRKRS